MTTNSYLEVNGQRLESLPSEVWKHSVANYWVSSMGRIATTNHKNSGKLKLMKPSHDHNGFLRTVFVVDGKPKTIKVHRVIATAFIENAENKPQVNHINFMRDDNRVSNLEWMTVSENMQHSLKAGRLKGWEKGQPQHKNCIRRGEDNGIHILTEQDVREIRAKFRPRIYTRKMLANAYGVSEATIKDVVLRRSWKHVK